MRKLFDRFCFDFNFRAGVMLALLLVMLAGAGITTGCATKGCIRAEAIDDLIYKVAERHDALVKEAAETGAMTETEAEVALRSTELLLQAVEAAKDTESE